jgi:hypothetical protein
MTIDCQFGDADAHGVLIHARAASPAAERRSSVGDVLAAGDFWGAGPTAPKEFIAQRGRNFRAIYEQANADKRKVRMAGSNMSNVDIAIGCGWA